jgi:enolase-phosphatase E1
VLPDVVRTKWSSPQFLPYRKAFPVEYTSDQAVFIEHVKDLMARDVKSSDLKRLQGYLWTTGYRTGELRASLFADVAPHFKKWKRDRIRIMIYSSGSVPAQKLLFKHTDGQPADLTSAITDYFDTVNAGPKMHASSYEKIARKYRRYEVAEWLFLSDNVKETEAAAKAGMQSFVVHRPGNPELPLDISDRYRVIKSFDEIGELK